MKKNISEIVEDLIKSKTPNKAQINEFIKANEDYEKMVQSGFTVKRGYNIMTTEEIYSPASNCSYSQSPEEFLSC